jgi:hypothetical protein
MPHINGKLKHGKTILNQVFAKPGRLFAVLSGFGRQIKIYHHPHDPILVEPLGPKI